jgi:ATP diphosphatase
MATANHKFETRFAHMEALLKRQGLSLNAATLDQMENEWQIVKNIPKD